MQQKYGQYVGLKDTLNPKFFTNRFEHKEKMFTTFGNFQKFYDPQMDKIASGINDNLKKNIAFDNKQGFLKFDRGTDKIIYDDGQQKFHFTSIDPSQIQDEWINDFYEGNLNFWYGEDKTSWIKRKLMVIDNGYESIFTSEEKIKFKHYSLYPYLFSTRKLTSDPQNPFKINSYIFLKVHVLKGYDKYKVFDYSERFLFKIDELPTTNIAEEQKYQEHIKKHYQLYDSIWKARKKRSKNVIPLKLVKNMILGIGVAKLGLNFYRRYKEKKQAI